MAMTLTRSGAVVMHTTEDIVRACYEAYVDKDRAVIENLLSHDFRFTSPRDNAIDRSAYLERCWPNSDKFRRIDVERIFVRVNEAFVTYEAEMNDGRRFRNTEFLSTRDGKITRVEVYFGWNVPHDTDR
jgi:ketosteroid isomerase-like protein